MLNVVENAIYINIYILRCINIYIYLFLSICVVHGCLLDGNIFQKCRELFKFLKMLFKLYFIKQKVKINLNIFSENNKELIKPKIFSVSLQ